MRTPGTADGRMHVLLVEDDADIRQLMAVVLRRAGHEVAVAARRSEAETLIAEHSFTAAVLDVCLPDGRGDHVAELLRKRAPHARIVMTSAAAHRSQVLQAAADAGDAFLLKPFSNADLISAVTTPHATNGRRD